MSPKELGAHMRGIRQSQGLSLEKAAEKYGIPAVVIGSYERADRNPNTPNLIAWLAAFGQRFAVLGPDDVVVRAHAGNGEVEWVVVYGNRQTIVCDSRVEAFDIHSHMPGSRVAFRTHVYGDLTFEGEQ